MYFYLGEYMCIGLGYVQECRLRNIGYRIPSKIVSWLTSELGTKLKNSMLT